MRDVNTEQSRAPDAIRQVSERTVRSLERYDFDLGGPLFDNQDIRMVDCGNVPGNMHDFSEHVARSQLAVEKILATGALPLIIGGDHAIPIPVLRAYKDRGPITLIRYATLACVSSLAVLTGGAAVAEAAPNCTAFNSAAFFATATLQDLAHCLDQGALLLPPGAPEDRPLFHAVRHATTPVVLDFLLGVAKERDELDDVLKARGTLWTALYAGDGGTGNLMTTLNKEAASDDLGLVLQSGFVTKALIGLFGTDRLRFAVSANGADFFDGFILDPATGIPDLPNLPRFKGYTNYDNYVGVGAWTTIGINTPITTIRQGNRVWL